MVDKSWAVLTSGRLESACIVINRYCYPWADRPRPSGQGSTARVDIDRRAPSGPIFSNRPIASHTYMKVSGVPHWSGRCDVTGGARRMAARGVRMLPGSLARRPPPLSPGPQLPGVPSSRRTHQRRVGVYVRILKERFQPLFFDSSMSITLRTGCYGNFRIVRCWNDTGILSRELLRRYERSNLRIATEYRKNIVVLSYRELTRTAAVQRGAGGSRKLTDPKTGGAPWSGSKAQHKPIHIKQRTELIICGRSLFRPSGRGTVEGAGECAGQGAAQGAAGALLGRLRGALRGDAADAIRGYISHKVDSLQLRDSALYEWRVLRSAVERRAVRYEL
ncbi:hypothetical protein RR46_03915 [Papilio xuthus]|uniref:Uncharacterized protein n=1 Tax=Papilio xuthus TaxID=66420 RepID=A0A194Q816_PAPXU|nr:hypothetical protein RR46_03915 [Papilio xuthus]